ncbi:hypothetical protein CAG71_09665 [Photobacterium halotolerans]|uniref:Uncharacterized protein n=2 Tax=Photobacterium halotolerans TaxID=265726 RepID=A0A7X5AZD3_9GAMM|nr:hypothetical protein [Photobacterium halotolerans]NAW66542.1 hypothetical protein [Photobacterium halotolerans]NAW86719.1 hypothetical protein [Photobacterium halotolerans]
MRKSNVLLLAAIIASPMAFASGNSPDADNIEGSFNDTVDKSLTVDVSKSKEIDYSFNEDNDDLYMRDIGNDKSKTIKDNSDNSWVVKKVSDVEIDKTFKKSYSMDKVLADSEIDGEVIKNEVTYGGACCDGKAGTVEVEHFNTMANSFGDASGISIAGQNAGNNSMVQQSTSTNATLSGSASY